MAGCASLGAGSGCWEPGSVGGCAVPSQQVKQSCCRDFTTHLSGRTWGVGEAAGKATSGKGDEAGAQTELLQGGQCTSHT